MKTLIALLCVVTIAYASISQNDWWGDCGTDPMTDIEDVGIINTAYSGLNSYLEAPKLYIGYVPENNDAWISIIWGQFVGSSNMTCQARLDDGELQTIHLRASNNGTTTHFGMSSKEATRFVESLASASQLIVRFTPYSSSPITATFRLEGLNYIMEQLGVKEVNSQIAYGIPSSTEYLKDPEFQPEPKPLIP